MLTYNQINLVHFLSKSILMTGENISSDISHFDWIGVYFLPVISSGFMWLIFAECLPGNPHGIFYFLTTCIPDSSYYLKDLNLPHRLQKLIVFHFQGIQQCSSDFIVGSCEDLIHYNTINLINIFKIPSGWNGEVDGQTIQLI